MSSARATTNKFCRSTDISNEASVESFFVLRLLSDFGYKDSEIRTKHAIQELQVARGRKKEPYRPDYLLVCSNLPRWLIDAKATTEDIEDFTYQCAGYALQINRKYPEKPCRYYMLTNGLLTRVYVWDQEEAILSLRFGDLVDGHIKYQGLKGLLSAPVVRIGWADAATATPARGHLLSRPSMDAVKKAFLRCHRIIWKSEKMSPQAAFLAFAKLLFVKLWEDRRLRDDPASLAAITKGERLPDCAVRFTTSWINQQEANDPNPVESILFRQLVDQLETDISQRRRKRIFEAMERLGLSAGTTKRVVAELEDYYLFGIDEDLNGRMFEAFLAATMRGQALGQYFTPRSVVKLMTRLAHPVANRQKIERVLDACCGTGGFLIEALTAMRKQIYNNRSLTRPERSQMLDEVANQAIFGVDAGRDPPIARVARINMYLHGDGGSRVYMTDSLRSPPEPSEADPIEAKAEVEEFAELIRSGALFDVVLTNPPFSMDYASTVPEEREILNSYDLSTYAGKQRTSLRSSVMFLESYWRLLRPGGRLLTVMDESVLGGRKFAFVRDFIRERFIIRATVSLHGDAFQRSGARAKTSILYLIKRASSSDPQPAAFVFESRYVGLDDVVPRTRPSVAEAAREAAAREMDEIEAAFHSYLNGEDGPWLVPASRLSARLDAKFLLPWTVGDLEGKWNRIGIGSDILENLVDCVRDPVDLQPDLQYRFLRITYEGYAEHGDRALGKEISYSYIGRTKLGDIVVSNISAVYRAICVIPEGMDDLLVSNEFTVLRLKPDVKADPQYLWSVLRSSAVIAEWLSGSSGVGRHRVDWEHLRSQRIPLLSDDKQKEIGDHYRAVSKLLSAALESRESARKALEILELEGESAQERLARAKPPR